MLLTIMHTVSYDFFSFLPREPSKVTNSNAYYFLQFFYPANQVTVLTVMHTISFDFFLPFKPSRVINSNAAISYGLFFFFTQQTK